MTEKKRNTIIFLIIASIFNLVLTVAFLILGLILIYWAFDRSGAENIGGYVYNLVLLGDLVAALVLSNLIYRGILALLQKKIDFEKHFDPIFKPRRRVK